MHPQSYAFIHTAAIQNTNKLKRLVCDSVFDVQLCVRCVTLCLVYDQTAEQTCRTVVYLRTNERTQTILRTNGRTKQQQQPCIERTRSTVRCVRSQHCLGITKKMSLKYFFRILILFE